MTPQSVYESPWHHPGLLASLGLVALTLAGAELLRAGPEGRARSPFRALWLAVFAPLIVLDAWLTTSPSPLGPAAGRVAAMALVILGDARLYLLLERFSRDPHPRATRPPAPALASALALSFVASLAVAAANLLFPAVFAVTRYSFLLYELLSLAMLLALRFGLLPSRLDARGASPAVRRWVLGLAGFFAVQYALWATADVLILSGLGVGWYLRLVPNVMYYGLFVEFVRRTSPPELRP